MIVYLDSTVVLRELLGTGKRWAGWGKWDKAYASVLLRTECCRAANKLHAAGKLDDAQRGKLGKWIESVCACVTTVPLTDEILSRAAEPFPVNVGTLQGLHLATMLELKAARGIACALATDDTGLLQAAESLGFENALEMPDSESVAADPKKPTETAS